MILTTIWERYFFREILKIFLLFLICFYGLYVLVDYSTHVQSFQNYRFTLPDIAAFYGYEFVRRMDVLIPFAILIASIKTLCNLNTHHELIALMASGINLKRILRPFVIFGSLFTLILYLNSEFMLPKTMEYRKSVEQARSMAKQKKFNNRLIQQLTLSDGTSLIFRYFDPGSEKFFDAYWIRSIDDMYRIHTLSLSSPPSGASVEHLQRNGEGKLVVVHFFDQTTFPEMIFNKKILLDTASSPGDRSISDLNRHILNQTSVTSEKDAEVLTTYYYKLGLPWICLLAALAPAPFCIRFSRSMPVFFIYAFSLFGLFAFYLILDAGAILAERQVISPALAIWLPFGCFFGFFGWRFSRVK